MKIQPKLLCKNGKLYAILGDKQLIGHIKKCKPCQLGIEIELRLEQLKQSKNN